MQLIKNKLWPNRVTNLKKVYKENYNKKVELKISVNISDLKEYRNE